MTQPRSFHRRLLTGTILMGSILLLAASAPAHAQQMSAAAPTTSTWFSVTYLTHTVEQSAATRFPLATLPIPTPHMAAPHTSAWFIATYLPEAPAPPRVTQTFSLAALHSRPARVATVSETAEAWYIATYLHASAAATTRHSLALMTLYTEPAHRSPVLGSEEWYRATYLGQPARQ